MHDILLLRISAILPEAISDGGLTPTTDTDLLLATYRGGSHLTSDIKDTVTYAVKETDKDGNVLDKDSFAYVVSGEGSVKLNESDQYHGSIEITNTKKDAAVTPGGSNGGSGTSNGGSDASSHGGSATSRPVKTGDPMNPVFWGLVLLVSVIVIAGGVVVYKKRKQK